jgi:hypothetical protein
MATRTTTFADFSGRIGKTFEVVVRGHKVLLVLDAAQELPGATRDGGAFRLEFLGPPDPQFAQGIFPFRIGSDSYDIFIVPLGPTARGMRYEAIFY